MVKSHKCTLAQLGPPPFTIVVPLNSLHTRAIEEPLPVSARLLMSNPQLPVAILPPRPVEEVLASDRIHATGSTAWNPGPDTGDMSSADEDSDMQEASDDN